MTASHEKGTISKVFIALLILVISYSVFTIVLHTVLSLIPKMAENIKRKKEKERKAKKETFLFSLCAHLANHLNYL